MTLAECRNRFPTLYDGTKQLDKWVENELIFSRTRRTKKRRKKNP